MECIYRSRCNIFNSFGNAIICMYIYKGRLVKISTNIAFLFNKEIYVKYLILYYNLLYSDEYIYKIYVLPRMGEGKVNSLFYSYYCIGSNLKRQSRMGNQKIYIHRIKCKTKTHHTVGTVIKSSR